MTDPEEKEASRLKVSHGALEILTKNKLSKYEVLDQYLSGKNPSPSGKHTMPDGSVIHIVSSADGTHLLSTEDLKRLDAMDEEPSDDVG